MISRLKLWIFVLAAVTLCFVGAASHESIAAEPAQRFVSFNPEITMGNILTMIGLVFGAMAFWTGFERRIARMEQKVDLIWRALRIKLTIGEIDDLRIDDEQRRVLTDSL